MPRVLISLPVDDEAGPRIGGSGTEVRVYRDKALTTLSTIYAEETGAGTLPNPVIPNAGFQTDLTVATLTTDTVITVRDVSGFAVGNLVPIYDGTTTTYRAITAINAGTKQLTLSAAIGVAYTVGPTLVGNPDMVGHFYAWLEDDLNPYFQVKDVASTRVLPPFSVAIKTPTVSVEVQEEGAVAGSRAKVNFIGPLVTAADDGVNARVNVTIVDAHTGELRMWLTDTPPTAAWLLCYGQAVSRTTYAALFAVISTTFGVGDGSTTFNLPDMRGRVPVGQDDMGGTAANRITAANAIGVSGGASTHTLSISEIPSHSHSHSHGSHFHKFAIDQNTGQNIDHSYVTGGSDHPAANHPNAGWVDTVDGLYNSWIRPTTPTTDATTAGSGSAHNNVKPYLTVNYIVRT